LVLLCDENLGKIPKALTLVGYDARDFKTLGWLGKKDIEWLPWVGKSQWLLLSCNKKQLIVPSERNAILQNDVGVVYLTQGEEFPAKVLLLLLKKWDTLELLWNTTEKPFARFLHPNGTLTSKYRSYQLPPHSSGEKQGRLI
jgi:hypothetical protein